MPTKNNKEIKNPYGLRNDKIVLISELNQGERGLNCNCICPSCKKPLIAKIGYGQKTPHFAHENTLCNNTYVTETSLHLLSKEILMESKTIRLPRVEVKLNTSNYPIELKEKLVHYEVLYEESEFEYNEILIENNIANFKPDIVLLKNNSKLIVEIAVTHFVDKSKLRKIKDQNISAIEIDLSKVYKSNLTRAQLKNILLKSTDYKHWIYNKKIEKREKELKNINAEEISKFHIKKETMKMIEVKRISALIEQSKNIQGLLQPSNYFKELLHLKNDLELKTFINDQNQFKLLSVKSLPFYVDLNITGDFIFNTDRRKWQAYIFFKYIYNNKHEVCLKKILDDLKNCNIFHIDWDKAKKLYLENNYTKLSLFYYTISTYLDFISLLGFIKTNRKIDRNKNYFVISNRIEPPNKNISTILKTYQNPDKYFPFYEKKLLKDLNSIRKEEVINTQDLIRQKNEYQEIEKYKLLIKKSVDNHELEQSRKRKLIENAHKELDYNFDYSETKKYIDKFNIQWVKCIYCGEIKEVSEMASYRNSLGKCDSCLKAFDKKIKYDTKAGTT